MQQNRVDVIVPVYAGEQETRRCLLALQATQGATAFEIVVIDDCSPEPELSAWLVKEAAAKRITLLRNHSNRGFVASVNRGMQLHPDRDVVLLNSDTEVVNDWLDRLVHCAYRMADTGTVTPLSNNATICSYPFEGWEGGVPGHLGLTALDHLVAQANAGQSIELPTAVGFCMFIRRACLQQIGLFDEENFGRGYGEENDFSFRARKAGWRNLLSADVFVYHDGGVSFAETRTVWMQQGAAALRELHPEYDDVVRCFIEKDPVQPLRQQVDKVRMLSGETEFCAVMDERRLEAERRRQRGQMRRAAQPVRLHITHSWGGGIERWTQDFCEADLTRRNLILCGRTSINETAFQLQLLDPLLGDEPIMCWELSEPIRATALAHSGYREIVQWVVAAFNVESVIVSSLIGHALDVFHLERPVMVVLHDFYPFCPALFACFNQACQSCGDPVLSDCFQSNPHHVFWHVSDQVQWSVLREAFAGCLSLPNVKIAAPSRDVYERFARLFPALTASPWQWIPHGLGAAFLRNCLAVQSDSVPDTTRRLCVLMPGRMLPHKGMWLLREALEALTEFADLILLGTGDFGAPFEACPGVTVIRDYEIGEMPRLVRRYQPDCALLASTLPESFSYTLSEMHALGIPVVATRMGAFVERIQHGETGMLVEPRADAVVACLKAFDVDRSSLVRMASVIRERPVRTAAEMVEAYSLWEGVALSLKPRPVVEKLIENLAEVPVLRAERADFAAEAAILRGEVAALRDDVNAHSLLVQNREARLAEIEALLAERERTVHAQALGLQQLQAERDALKASLSWRVTRPLRAVGRMVSRLRARSSAAEATPHDPSVLQTEAVVAVKVEMDEVFESVVSEQMADRHDEALDEVMAIPSVTMPQKVQVEEWGLEPGYRYRQTLRHLVREKLGLPAAASIVIGLGGAERSALRCFVDLATRVTAQRTSVVFVWIESDVEPYAAGSVVLDMGLLAETRDFFVVGGDPLPWLLGADIYLECGSLVNRKVIIPDGLPVVTCGLVADSGSIEMQACGDRLLDRLDGCRRSS